MLDHSQNYFTSIYESALVEFLHRGWHGQRRWLLSCHLIEQESAVQLVFNPSPRCPQYSRHSQYWAAFRVEQAAARFLRSVEFADQRLKRYRRSMQYLNVAAVIGWHFFVMLPPGAQSTLVDTRQLLWRICRGRRTRPWLDPTAVDSHHGLYKPFRM